MGEDKRLNLEKRNKDGGRLILIGVVIVVFALLVGARGPETEANFRTGSACCLVVLGGFLIFGGGSIMFTGKLLFPGERMLFSCPGCGAEIPADQVPDPGRGTNCPKCGRLLMRRSWHSWD